MCIHKVLEVKNFLIRKSHESLEAGVVKKLGPKFQFRLKNFLMKRCLNF